MKKYIAIIVVIGLLLTGVLIYNTIIIEKENQKVFQDSGYILQSVSGVNETQNVERYYFNSQEKYKEKYEQKVIFKNTEDEEVVTNLDNFIHYSNGSVSAFSNGVLLNLDDIEQDPIRYYNISANRVLSKDGTSYKIKNLNQELVFNHVIWKISDQKYIILGEEIKLVFDDGTEKIIQGYVELEYLDNEIIKIYNQEVTYQTISSKAYIDLPNEIRINLGTKIVSKQNSNKMSLDNMVIDSDDNVTIANIEEVTEEVAETNEQETAQEEGTNGETGGQSSTGQVSNEQQTIINNSSQTITNGEISKPADKENEEDINDEDDDKNTTVNEDENIIDDEIGTSVQTTKTPVFKVTNFEVNAIGVDATINIEDEDNTIISDTTVNILDNSTGKTVYQYTEPFGVYSIDISVSTLVPDHEYTLVAEAVYKIDEMEYTRNFIYKIFRTSTIGINIEKDVFTSNSLGIAVNINKDANIKSAEIVLSDAEGNRLQSQTVLKKSALTADQKEIIEFMNLKSNTNYTISVTNVLYDGQIITNGFRLNTTFTTLKQKPEISGTEYEINKRDGNFVLKLKNIEDPDKGIQSYQFQIFDTRITDSEEPVKVVDSKEPEIKLAIDEDIIHRNVGYTFKVVAIFEDNEKTCEYESEYSQVFKMDGVEFPTIRFEQKEVTFERIEGNIIVEDEGKTIDLSNGNRFIVTYTDSVGITKSFTSEGSYVIPIDVNNLRANETYKFAVYTTVDLQDGNDPIDKCYIGGITVKTGTPKNMVAKFSKIEDDVKNAFNVSFKLQQEYPEQGTLEPETLTGMTVSIYAGQTADGELPTGSPLRTVKLVDNNLKEYVSTLKQEYYDNTAQITPAFFNAKNEDFRDSYYTIVVSSAYDYTDYQNTLPILNNVFTIKTNGYMPDLPTDVNNALIVEPIRNYTSENPREELLDNTIVGYRVKAIYDNNGLYAKEVIYKVYDAKTNKIIDTISIPIGQDGVIPTAKFDVLDGTANTTQDNELRRGNSYYFTYEMMLDLNGDGIAETKYPYEDENTVLKSPTQTPLKQMPTIYMYPSVSTNASITFKYRYQDIDNTLVNDRRISAKIGNGIVDTKMLIETTGTDTYNEITFENLSKGTLTLQLTEALEKGKQNDREILEQYFEGYNSIAGIKYSLQVDVNKVSISFADSSNQLKYVSGVRVEFLEKTEGNNGIKIVKDFQKIPDNNILSIDYRDLGELLKKQTIVNVYAYYDSGITGYDTDTSKYVTYQKAYKTAGEQTYYYTISQEGDFIDNTSISGNMYASQRTNNLLKLENKFNNRTIELELTYGENGFKYQGDVILQKQIDEKQLEYTGSNEIYFEKIIPGISLKDNQDNWTIQTELDQVNFKAELLVHPETLLVDGKVYVDLYQTDEEYKTETFLKTLEYKKEDFDNIITIDGLQPKNYYFIKFRAKINNDDGSVREVDLYDIDYQVSGRQYYFSTLANVNIDNIEIKYNPISYEEKYIDITYTLEKITGYTRIEYNLYHFNEETKTYEKIMNIEPDLIFRNDMKKELNINPGSEFIFGDKYKIEIIPIAEYTGLDGQLTILELGKKEKEFTLEKLQNPVIAIKGAREEDDKVNFRITVYDDSKVIQGNKYTIKILNKNLEDITPEEYKKDFDINTINNTITINDAKKEEAYTIVVITKVDLNNNGVDLTDYSRDFKVQAVNKYGILLGDVTANKSELADEKIDLFFNNSYKLTEIEGIKYSIYNTNGYSQSGTQEFIPKQITAGDETYYSFTLDIPLTSYEKYYIELQFFKADEMIETLTLEYVYLDE